MVGTLKEMHEIDAQRLVRRIRVLAEALQELYPEDVRIIHDTVSVRSGSLAALTIQQMLNYPVLGE